MVSVPLCVRGMTAECLWIGSMELIDSYVILIAAGLWVGDCFVYNNSAWRLNYCVGGEVTVMYHLDRPMYLLGYLVKEARVYLIDKVSCPQQRASHETPSLTSDN